MDKFTNNPSPNGNSDMKKENQPLMFPSPQEPMFQHLNAVMDHSGENKQNTGIPFMLNNNMMPPPENSIAYEDHNLNYYQEYCRLFIANVVLTTQMKELVSEKNELLSKLEKLEKKTEEYNQKLNESLNERKKRMRRTAEEIDRHFKCTIDNCNKTYGSEGSLNQHIKLKHPDHYSLMTQNLVMNSSMNSNDNASRTREKEEEEEKKDN